MVGPLSQAATTEGIGQDLSMAPIGFAHRGARRELPENTLAAFGRALELGATGLESDAWLAADGEVVLTHDPVVRRGFRRMRVRTSSADELATFGVPRLADVYDTLGVDFEFSLDVKDESAAMPAIEVARAAGADRSGGASGRLWLCSPSLVLLQGIRATAPEVKVVHSIRKAALSTPLERHASELHEFGIDALNMHHSDWSAGVVGLFHKFEVQAFGWDAQEVRHIEGLVRIGIDALYCDWPDRMMATIAASLRRPD